MNKNYTLLFLLALLIFSTASASARRTETTHAVQVKPGWNLLALPASVNNGSKDFLFPTSASPAFIFQAQSGYTAQDTLRNGVGFWLKFTSADTVLIQGTGVLADTIAVQAGWNLIGTLTMDITTTAIQTEPEGIISSPFFGYEPGVGYQQTDTLHAARGYWVKASQAGSLILSWKNVLLNDSTKQPEVLPNFVSVTLDSSELVLTYASGGDLPTLLPGDILVGNSEGGYARRVVSAVPSGNQLIVATEKVSVDQYIDIARVDTTYPIEFPDLETLNRLLGKPLRSQGYTDGKFYSISASTPLISLSPNAQILTLKFPNFTLELEDEGDVSVSVTIDTVTFSLQAGIHSLTFDYFFGLRECRVIVRLVPSIKFDGAELAVNLSLFERSFEHALIPSIPLGAIPTPIPGLILIPEFNLEAGISAEASVSAGVSGDGTMEMGLTVDAGFQLVSGFLVPVGNVSPFGSVQATFQPAGSASAEVKIFLRPSLDMTIWSTLGVGVFVEPYQYNELTFPPLAVEVGGGVAAGVEAQMDIFDHSLFRVGWAVIDERWPWFTTHGPSIPSNPNPASAATGVSISPTLSWTCTDPDGDPITYDVYFGTDNPPAALVASNQSANSLPRSGLTGGTTYYWKVVARDNSNNTTPGPVWSFTTTSGGGGTPCATPTVTYAGKTYNTVQIGSQCWLRENLDVGTMILGSQEQTNNGTIEKYCYNNDPANCNTYGGLYQWNEAMQYSTTPGVQGICPPGWHLPTLAEFQTLSSTVGGNGNALKAIGQGTGGGAGTNTSGFSALLAGYRNDNGSFSYLGYGFFWSSTQYYATLAHYLNLYYNNAFIYLTNTNKSYGFSVRCLED